MVVIDTSIAYKWITDEDADTPSPALELFNNFINGKENVLIPDILLYELANALSTKSKLTFKEIEYAWNFFGRLSLKIIYPTIEFTKKAIKFSREYHVTVYDASYAVLAMEKNCVLFTADSKFVKRTSLPFIKSIDRYQLY